MRARTGCLVWIGLAAFLSGCGSSPGSGPTDGPRPAGEGGAGREAAPEPRAAALQLPAGYSRSYRVEADFSLDGGSRRIAWQGRWTFRMQDANGQDGEALPSLRLAPASLVHRCAGTLGVVSTQPGALGMVSRPACLVREGIPGDELESWVGGAGAADPAVSTGLSLYRGGQRPYLSNERKLSGALFVQGCRDGRFRELGRLHVPGGALTLLPGGTTDEPDRLQARSVVLSEVQGQAWEELRACTDGDRLGAPPAGESLTTDLVRSGLTETGAPDERTEAVDELVLALESRALEGRLSTEKARAIARQLAALQSNRETERSGRTLLTLEEARADLAGALGGGLDRELAGLFDRASSEALGPVPTFSGPLPRFCVRPPAVCDSPPVHVDGSAEYGPGKSPDGSRERPFPTLGAAMDAIRGRGLDCAPIVMVASGLYRENLLEPPSVRLRARPRDRPVILGQIEVKGSTSFELNGIWISGSWDGPALRMGSCSSVDVLTSRIVGSTRYGIHQTGGRLRLTDAEVIGVRREGEGRTAGTALYQQGGSAVLHGVRFRFNAGPAILSEGRSSRIEGSNVEVHESGVLWPGGLTPGELSELPAGLGAVEAGDGARVTLRNTALTDNEFIGLLAREGGSVEFTGSRVSRTRQLQVEDAGSSGVSAYGGFGAYALGGAVRLEDFTISDHPLCGLGVAREGDLDAVGGLVTRNQIGACVAVPDYAIERIMTDVLYQDNEINLDSATLPVAEPEVPGEGSR